MRRVTVFGSTGSIGESTLDLLSREQDVQVIALTGGRNVERLAEQATEDGWPAIALVAVNDAVGFWSHHGFVEQPAEAMAAKLASYGADARYMLRPL